MSTLFIQHQSDNEYRSLQIETYFQFDMFLKNTYNIFFQEKQKRINISPNGFDGEDYRLKRFQEEKHLFSCEECKILEHQFEITHYTHDISCLYQQPVFLYEVTNYA